MSPLHLVCRLANCSVRLFVDAPELPPALEQCKAKDAAAYVCSGTACQASVGGPDALTELLA